MTVRSFVLGLVGALLICTLTYLNDYVLRQTYLVGNHLPVSIYGTLIIFLAVNLLLYRISQKLALTGKELVVILVMTLSVCAIPSSGLLRTFTSVMMLPHFFAKTKPGWQKYRATTEITPETLLVNIRKEIFQSTIKEAKDVTVVLEDPISLDIKSLDQPQIHIYLEGGAVRKVRSIVDYDKEKNALILDAPLEGMVPTGVVGKITVNNEDTVLTPFLQGEKTQSTYQYEVPYVGESRTVKRKELILEDPNPVPVPNYFAGMDIIFKGGPLENVQRKIVAYYPEEKRIVWDPELDVEPIPPVGFEIKPPKSQTLFRRQLPIETWVVGNGNDHLLLGPTFTTVGDAFVNSEVEFLDGPLAGQRFLVIDYVGNERKLVFKEKLGEHSLMGKRIRLLLNFPAITYRGELTVLASNKVRLSSYATYQDNFYNGMQLIVEKDGIKSVVKVTGYDGKEQVATTNPEIKEFPVGTTAYYQIIPPPLIPWDAWRDTLLFWVPLLLFLWLAFFGLNLVFHRQWSEHEHLPYPIASFTDMLLPDNESGRVQLFAQRGFLIAMGVVFCLYMYNYLQQWFPNYLVAVPLSFDIWSLVNLLPMKGPVYQVAYIRIFFTVIAIAYFLPSDVSLSLGLSKYLYCLVVGILVGWGINLQEGGGTRWTQYECYLAMGSYIGAVIMFLYTGRYFYLNVIKKSIGLPTQEQIPAYSVWGARLFLICMIAFVCWLQWKAHLPWVFALMYFIASVIMHSGMARLISETGLFFIQTWFMPGMILIGLLGINALSPEMIVVLAFVTIQFSIDPREALMPYLANSFKLVEMRQQKLGKIATACLVSLLVGVCVAVPWTIYNQYKRGVNFFDTWGNGIVPQYPIDEVVYNIQKMEDLKILKEVRELSTWERILRIRPVKWSLVYALLVGIALYVLTAVARLRIPNWPIHPVLFMVWIAWAPGNFVSSFLIGWLLKTIVMRFGGIRTFHKLKPVLIGLVAGELLGAMIPILVGFIYFLITGDTPQNFRVFPG